MSANVETMFSVRETPWHKLGIVIESAPTSKDAIILAGLNWNVVQKPVYTSSGIIPGYKANVRDYDEKILGLVTDRYRIVQNTEAFEFTDALLGEGVKYETAGSLASGKRVWLLARMETTTITDEKIDPYLVFTNSHDGTGAIRVALTPVRVVCQNTLNLAMKNASRHWSAVHTGDIKGKLADAENTLFNAKAYMKALEEEFGELKLIKLSDSKLDEYINMLLPIDEVKDSTRKINNIIDMREELRYRYMNAPDLQPVEKSAYRFINAVSDFATHTEPKRRTQNFKENLFMRTIDGNALIDKAYAISKAMAA